MDKAATDSGPMYSKHTVYRPRVALVARTHAQS
jgi:hypothetical protein